MSIGKRRKFSEKVPYLREKGRFCQTPPFSPKGVENGTWRTGFSLLLQQFEVINQ
jgi:hypothetical protein